MSFNSEYDKAGDFYFNWLDKNLPNRDRYIQPSIEIMLAMLGNVQGIKICDLGCGDGYLSRILASRGALVSGVDISRNLLRHAKGHSSQLDITYLLDDAQSMSQVSEASLDAVICNMVLMDIHDLSATMSSVRRVLVDGMALKANGSRTGPGCVERLAATIEPFQRISTPCPPVGSNLRRSLSRSILF